MSSLVRLKQKRATEWATRLEPLMHQPLKNYRGKSGAYVEEGGGKIRLSKKGHQEITEAGRVYWEDILGVPPPRKFDYNQPLELDKFIRSRTGERIQVRRRRVDGSYAVLPAGEPYFRHHRALWIPSIPRLVVTIIDGEYKVHPPRGESGYVTLADLPHLTTATLREKEGGQDGRGLVATDEEQRAEVITLTMVHIRTLDTMRVEGVWTTTSCSTTAMSTTSSTRIDRSS